MREIATVHFRDQESGDAGLIIVTVDPERKTVSLTTSLREDGDIHANLDAGTVEQLIRALMEAHHQVPKKQPALDVPAPGAFQAVINTIVDCLADGNYDAAITAAPKSRMRAPDIAQAVRDYGRRLVPTPAYATNQLDVVRVETGETPTWHVAVPLWTAEEGMSDLTLELWLKLVSSGIYEAEILNIHVL